MASDDSDRKIQEQRLWETTKIWYTVSERSQNCYIRFPLRNAQGKRPMYIIYADTRQGLQIGLKEDESKNGPVNETSICHVRPGATMELFNQTISKSELEINNPRLAKTLYEATDTDPVGRMHLMINYWKSIGLVEKLNPQYYATRGHTGYAKKPKDLQPRELEAEKIKTERLREEMNKKIAEYCAKYGKEALAAAEAKKAAAEAKKAATTSSSKPAKSAPEQSKTAKTAKTAAPAAPTARRPTASAPSKPRLQDGSRAPITPTSNSALPAKHRNKDTSVKSGPASEPRLSTSTGELKKSRRKGPFIYSSDEEDGTSGAPARQTPGGGNKDDGARSRSQNRSDRRPTRARSQSSDSSGLFVRQSPSPPRVIPDDTSEWEPSGHEDAHSKPNKGKGKGKAPVEDLSKAERLMTAWSARIEKEKKAIAELKKQLKKDTSDLNKRKPDMKPREFADKELQLKKRNGSIANRETELQEAIVSYEKAISDSREGTPVPEEKIVQQTLQSMRGETRKMTETPAPPKRNNRDRSKTRHGVGSDEILPSTEHQGRKRRAESPNRAKPKRPGVSGDNGEPTKVGSSSRRKHRNKEVISDESDHYIGNERVNERTGLREGGNWVENSGPQNPTYLERETMELERAQKKTLRRMIKAWEDKGSKGRKPTINDV